MVVTRPVLGCGLAQVHVYDRDGVTSRGVLKGSELTCTWSKSVDGSSLSFTASPAEAALVADPDMLEDALCIIELDVGGTPTPWGTPFVLSPGTGTVVGVQEGASRQFQPSGVGAAVGLCGEWLVLHSGGVVNRLGPSDRYLGWPTASFDDSAWPAADEVDPADLSITDAKYQEPYGWPSVAAAATWTYRRPASEGGTDGGLTLLRFGSFTVDTARKYIIGFSCDEESKVHLDGPGFGGVILESSDQETGYTIKNVWGRVLQPGTYFVSAEMTTVNSEGGDGFDAARMFVATVDNKGRADDVVLMSGSGTKVWRQAKTAVRPGFTVDDLLEILRAENETWGIPSASLLTVLAADTLPDGEERVWPVGTSVAQVLSDLEVDVAIDVDTDWNLTVWGARTVDLTATVALVEGAEVATADMNLEGLGYNSDPVTGTRAVVLTNDGYVEVIDTDAEAAIAARGMYLESSASGSIAKGRAYGMDAIAQAGLVRRNYQADDMPVSGVIPGVDFGPCAVITAPNWLKVPSDMQVLSIVLANQSTAAHATLDLTEF